MKRLEENVKAVPRKTVERKVMAYHRPAYPLMWWGQLQQSAVRIWVTKNWIH
jgi:hypothetical protein